MGRLFRIGGRDRRQPLAGARQWVTIARTYSEVSDLGAGLLVIDVDPHRGDSRSAQSGFLVGSSSVIVIEILEPLP